MEKTYKRVPFDIELAKDITCGKVEGRIYFETTLADESKTDAWIIKSIHDLKNEDDPYYVISECDNQEYIEYMNTKDYIPQQLVYAVIELPEETPKQLNGLAGCDGQCHSCTNDCTLRKYDICTHDFKIGDKVSIGDYNGEDAEIYKIVKIRENLAFLNDGSTIPLDGLVLIESKHEFKPFDKVLVRDYEDDVWTANLYSHTMYDSAYPYGVFCGCYYKQCIPYEGNEHLVGTTDEPKEE